MPRSIDYRSTSPHPADQVYAMMVDADFLRTRLTEIGGPGAALEEHAADAETAAYRLRHGLDESQLPSMVRSLFAGEIVVERAETWKRVAAGRYEGQVAVRIPGTPAGATGWMRLGDIAAGGSELHVHADVTVRVPLIGGKIESTVGEQMVELLDLETAFLKSHL